MTRVVCVGAAVQELVFEFDLPVLMGETNAAARLRAVGGGAAANGAVAIERLGGEASLITALGEDAIGDAIIAELAMHGVGAERIRRVIAPSPLSAVLIDPEGDRTTINRTDPSLWRRAEPPGILEIDGGDAVLADIAWLDGAASAIAAANDLGMPSVVSCDVIDEEVPLELLEAASHVVFSQPAFERVVRFATASSVADVAQRVGGFVAVSKGSDGVLWSDGGPAHRVEAFGARTIDRPGAGDVFRGALALSVAEGHRIDDMVRWSAAAAVIASARGGGREDFPSRVDVAAYLEEGVE